MSRFEPILFDLDGTIADTRPGILRAVAQALAALELTPVPEAAVVDAMGRGTAALIARIVEELDAPATAAARLKTVYEEAYASECGEGTLLYPGIRELLERLPGPLGLVTNKARRFTVSILAQLGLDRRFDAVVAGDDVPPELMKPDPRIVLELLRRLGGARPILIGDSDADIACGTAAGLPTCAVTWGYRSPRTTRPTYRAASCTELEALLLGG